MSTPMEEIACDVLVIGSGAGGLSAALGAGLRGLETIVVEKGEGIGGTSSWSGGWIWVPCNPMADRDGVPDSLDSARAYLRERLGDGYDARMVDAYLDGGRRMLEEYSGRTEVEFEPGGYIFPDYYPDSPHALTGSGRSRSLRPVAFDGRKLRRETVAKLSSMPPQLTLFGMLIGSLVETTHFINATSSLASARFVMRKVARFVRDRIFHGRDMSLVNGQALVARLAHSLDHLGVQMWVSAPAVQLLSSDAEGEQRVHGAIVVRNGKRLRIHARRGVVLACGGFPRDERRKSQYYSHVAAGGKHYAVAPETNTGDGLSLGESVGGAIPNDRSWNCLFMPVSLIPGKTGAAAVFPHIWDRSKPGFIAVTPRGQRFVNEATSYMKFGKAMVQASQGSADVRAWLLCDHAAVKRYGIGIARPMLPLAPYLRSGYLRRAATVEELAQKIGVAAEVLQATVSDYNRDAATGVDRRFGKGGDPFSRFQGDAGVLPNPNMAPLATAPYYAVELFCGDFGTFTGLRTDAHARVLGNLDGAPIPGLYAVGNDMATVMAGHSVGGGISLGPAMVFGYLAACDISTREHTQSGAGQGAQSRK